MGNYKVSRRGDTSSGEGGIWTGAIGFQCPWAHPVWSEYLLLIYDLNTEMPNGKKAHKHNEAATHEFVLFSLAPETRINFDVNLYEQKSLSPLTPFNHGYQFVAESNEAAWDRVNSLIDACYREVTRGRYVLNPDSDYRADWDKRMEDGWSLRET
jgi:hypothetical protein